MKIGIVGLGHMGSRMALRLLKGGHHCVVYRSRRESAVELEAAGAVVASSLQNLVDQLERPRAIWVIQPTGIIQAPVRELLPLLSPADMLIDGGNSYGYSAARRELALGARGILHIDVEMRPAGSGRRRSRQQGLVAVASSNR